MFIKKARFSIKIKAIIIQQPTMAVAADLFSATNPAASKGISNP